MAQTLQEINHEAFEVISNENTRAREYGAKVSEQLSSEHWQHALTQQRLMRSVAIQVLLCKKLKKSGMFPVYTIEFLNFLNPKRDSAKHMITSEDVKWAENVLAGIKANFDRPPSPEVGTHAA